jgi:hypothetical protein
VYGVLADLIVVAHLGFVGFACLGGLLVVRWRWVAWIHIPCAVWAVVVEWLNLVCPLTPWEQRLRDLADQPGYTGGFIENYLTPILYPAGLNRTVQMLLGALVVAINVSVYVSLFYRRTKSGAPGNDGP